MPKTGKFMRTYNRLMVVGRDGELLRLGTGFLSAVTMFWNQMAVIFAQLYEGRSNPSSAVSLSMVNYGPKH